VELVALRAGAAEAARNAWAKSICCIVAMVNLHRAVSGEQSIISTPISMSRSVSQTLRRRGFPAARYRSIFAVSEILPPMHYLRDARLDKVHEALRRAEPEENVISISRWGFLHMGRFAAVYRKRFGEAPSETLANGSRLPASRCA
jgi:AraC-like DNA-binding protein